MGRYRWTPEEARRCGRLGAAVSNAKRVLVPPAERFWLKVQKTDGCWVWTGQLDRGGYGVFRDAAGLGVRARASRVSYALSFGEIPAGMCVCHRCDNRKCVRPDHLFLGTLAENNTDRHQKGRSGSHKGEANGRSRLNEENVREVKRELAHGRSRRELATRFDVSRGAIDDIAQGRRWAHVAPSLSALEVDAVLDCLLGDEIARVAS